ncbi:E1-E2 ATPase family protein [Babesia bovis T2Bo]|uniref:Cation transporting ATPase, putative n=1 Tax=Babesia bovis TaxID=5865 RepID=A7AVP4_BABBO|nr:E1-E2 ATPase family protein [Babesia bovis T2Bo]EDO05870.1 E1-E2 ATPase family protein [Babesia bovis T2Bo]|eukprot:XP_001609438.1 cation transporting ATPase [Babesia bovis T2Bo]
MAKVGHTRSVYRYVGKDAVFLRFSITVFVLAISSCVFHSRKIFEILSIFTEPMSDSSVKGQDVGLRIDFGHIGNRLKSQTKGETFLMVLLALVLMLLIAMLLCLWSIKTRLFFFYDRCMFIEGSDEFSIYVRRVATHVYVTEPSSVDSLDEHKTHDAVLIPLKKSRLYTYYRYGHRKYILDDASGSFRAVEHIDSVNRNVLASWRGLSAKDSGSNTSLGMERSLTVCGETYGDNDYEIPACNFWSMLFDAFLSPFFIFQLGSSLMWILDDYWYYSMLSVFAIVVIEVQMVNKRIRDYDRINSMRIPPNNVTVYRDGKWHSISSTGLYPGDLFLLSHDPASSATIAPADCLILSGEVVVDESILTGESVPQFKSAFDLNEVSTRQSVATDGELRQCTVFSGTSIVLCRTEGKSFSGLVTPKSGCVCVVLRTGFESYQGRLVNAIMHSGDRVSASTTEGWCFLGILLTFAVTSCIFVIKRLPTATLKKLILTVLHIITSVIPPEFPVILSMAVTLAILQLHKRGIYCTEPFRVPYAGQLDVCAFDKTGTLTDDHMKVAGVVLDDSTMPDKGNTDEIPIPISTALVIGGCHSITRVGGKTVGDPMEKAGFEHLGWTLCNDNKTVESHQPWFFNTNTSIAQSKITILRRWQFTSELGRMSTIISVKGNASYWSKDILNAVSNAAKNAGNPGATASPYGNSTISFDNTYDGCIMLLCKGAPERLRPLLRDVPNYYDSVYQRLAIGGMRVIALACKRLVINPEDAASVLRSEVECDLDFVGFLALEAPIKPSSIICMRQLEGHKIVMITGDNVLTACHVADTVEIGDRRIDKYHSSIAVNSDFAILVADGKRFTWRLRNGEPISKGGIDFISEMHQLKSSMRLCITGPTIDALITFERETGRKALVHVVLNATVFARVSPQQKEFIIRTFKRAGMKTSMCGDGTNDMAALKASHVGISLLKSAFTKNSGSNVGKLSDLINRHKNVRHRAMLEELKRDLEDEIPELKLGEASIASPFTYRKSDVYCVPLLVRSGRCALTNVVVMYKIIGINSLITSLSMSVLAVDGVNFSDAQTTAYSLLYTAMLMALSRSKPSQVHSTKRPEESIFKPSNFTSFALQCCLHVGVIMRLWSLGMIGRPPGYVADLDTPFEANLVNTLVFYGCFVVNISGFLANYQGYPYMESLMDNKFVYRPLAAATFFILLLVCDLISPLANFFSLVEIPGHMIRLHVIAILLLDMVGSFFIEHGCRRLLSP